MKIVKRILSILTTFVIAFFTLAADISTSTQTPVEARRLSAHKRIYVDMVADLFHAGHIEFLKQARAFGDYLIVGLDSDEDCVTYKRRPILNIEERAKAVEACRYVDEVIKNVPLVTTDEFIDKYHIDVVVHGNDFDVTKINKYYAAPIRRGIFVTIPYTKGISTTDIIRRIRDRKPEEL
jgi:cytidyltransferase-like protein